MFNSLLPKGAPFFELLLQQNQILCTVANELAALIERLDNPKDQREKILALEDEADHIYLTITKHLSQSFLTPIDREDILHINKAQEEAIDLFNNLSTRLSFLGFKQARVPMLQLAKTVQAMTMLTRSMLVGLSEKRDSHNTREFRTLRNECEMLLSTGIAELYELGKATDGSVLEIIKWSRTYDRMEKLIVYLVEVDEAVEEAVLKHV
ncbi:MAG: DUF47 family protein [Desulfovibrionaceae bacterium]|nr:DUF47 family protein [Desulfovibrionaceae bacterium]